MCLKPFPKNSIIDKEGIRWTVSDFVIQRDKLPKQYNSIFIDGIEYATNCNINYCYKID